MAPSCSKKKGIISIRESEEDQTAGNRGSQREEHEGNQPPPNEDVIAKMAEFVRENPSIFEQLERFFKKKRKEMAESSKCGPNYSPSESTDRRSITRHSRRETSEHYDKQSKVGVFLKCYWVACVRKWMHTHLKEGHLIPLVATELPLCARD